MINRICWDGYNLSQLFHKVSNAAYMYSKEADSGEETYNEDMTMPALDTLPHAMLYRARVCEQYLDEIKARAYDMLQEEYDSKSKEDKITWHREEADKYARMLSEEYREGRDKKVIADWEQELQLHESFIFRLENFPQGAMTKVVNKYLFGEGNA